MDKSFFLSEHKIFEVMCAENSLYKDIMPYLSRYSSCIIFPSQFEEVKNHMSKNSDFFIFSIDRNLTINKTRTIYENNRYLLFFVNFIDVYLFHQAGDTTVFDLLLKQK